MTAIQWVSPIMLLAALSGCGGTEQVEPIAVVKAHGFMSSMRFAPSGSSLAMAGTGREQGRSASASAVILWDPASQKTLRRIPVPEEVQGIAFAPDGKTLAVADGGTQGSGHAYVFDPVSGARLKTFGGSSGWIHGLEFSPDGSLLAACGSKWDATADGYKDGMVAIWEVASGQEQAGDEWSEGTYRAISFAPGGKAYATGGGTCRDPSSDWGEVRLWDAETGQIHWSRRGHTAVVVAVAFAPDGETIASGGMDGVLKLWKAVDGTLLFTAKLGPDQRWGHVLAVAFSTDGKYLLGGLGSFHRGSRWGELRAWEIRTKSIRELSIFTGPAPITCIACSPDGRLLAAGDGEGTVRLWESAKVFAAPR